MQRIAIQRRVIGADVEPYSLGTSVLQLVGCSCCCLFAVVVIVGVAVLAFRGGKSKADGVEGAPAAPDRGSKATASLTKMESHPEPDPEIGDADGATVVLTRSSHAVPPPLPASAPAITLPKPVAAPPPVPVAPPAPPPVPAPKPPRLHSASPTFQGVADETPPVRAPRAGPESFVPGRTIVVDDQDDVPMPPPLKK